MLLPLTPILSKKHTTIERFVRPLDFTALDFSKLIRFVLCHFYDNESTIDLGGWGYINVQKCLIVQPYFG